MKEGFFSTASTRILGSLVLLMVLIAMGSYASLNFEKIAYINPMPATISVTGEGEVMAVPDVGQFSFAVEAQAPNAAEAQELSGTKINAILAYLKDQGIEEKDIKTQNYNLYPNWRYEEQPCAIGSFYCPPGEQIQDGFTVNQSVSVKVRATDTAGAIIAGVGEQGATNISSLNFTVDDTDALKQEARAKAIKDAQDKAVVLAQQLGVRLTKMQYYYEEDGHYDQPHYGNEMAYSMAAKEESFDGAQMPLGENSTTARVTITYTVK
jgi:hypothetical protein